MPAITGFAHLALTVNDVDRSSKWYQDVFETPPVVEVPGLTILFSADNGLMFGLRTHEGQKGGEFTHLATGLDHMGFGVESKEELEKWQGRFDELGVKNSGIEKSQFGYHLNFRDPDNIPLELFVLEMGG